MENEMVKITMAELMDLLKLKIRVEIITETLAKDDRDTYYSRSDIINWLGISLEK